MGGGPSPFTKLQLGLFLGQTREASMQNIDPRRVEALGPAEKIIQTLTNFTDHIYHGRPGVVFKDDNMVTGVRWQRAGWREKDGEKIVFVHDKMGKKTVERRFGVLNNNEIVIERGRAAGYYKPPGLFTEVATYLYSRVAEVWKLDNEFAARWASWAYKQDYKDLKVVLAAFMLVQSRHGEAVKEGDDIVFIDEDFRAVGEAMCLLDGQGYMDVKLLLRIGEILDIPAVAKINLDLGFGKSHRNPPHGRYTTAIRKWLTYRENNVPMLKGLVKAGFKNKVKVLASKIGYKPTTEVFFDVLGWKQSQAKDGRRTIAIGKEVTKETWEGLTEYEICNKIVDTKPGYKRLVGLLPKEIGLTQAIMAAAVESGSLSKADLIILTPTLEELGLLKIKEIKEKWRGAVEAATNQRAANVAKNVRTKEAQEGLQEAADKATVKALEEVTRDLRVYVVIDISASMDQALDEAKSYLTKFLGGFPLDRTHVSVFNTYGREVQIKSPTAAGVSGAFKGIHAGGGTTYGAGVAALQKYQPKENEDSIIIFVGDQADSHPKKLVDVISKSGIDPVAIGLLEVRGQFGNGTVVEDAGRDLEIPVFSIDKEMFQVSDPYSITRTLRNLISATPVKKGGVQARRKTLIMEILGTELLQKPVWA